MDGLKAKKYSSTRHKLIVSVESRCDKRGNIFFVCNYGNNEENYVSFENFSSVIDFIKTNFV